MKILDKYVIKEVSKYMGICILIFTSIYLAIDILQKIDDFMEAKVQETIMFKYFLYKIPFIAVQMIPIAILISVIVTFSLMKKNNELVALQTSGISIKRISFPAIGIAIIIVFLSFFFSELIVPYTSSKAENIWNRDVKKGRYKRFFKRKNICYKGKDCIFWIEYFDGKNMIMKKAIFYFFNKKFVLIKRIQAKRVIWTGRTWIAENGIEQTARIKRKGFNLKRFDSKLLNISETPDSFLRPMKKPEEMNYWQLRRFAKEIKKEGYNAKRYFVDTYMKLAFPFINLVVVLVGVPASIKLKKSSIPMAISLGIGICFLYIMFMGIFRSLGISGVLPSFLSAWMANILFLLFGIYMIIHIEK